MQYRSDSIIALRLFFLLVVLLFFPAVVLASDWIPVLQGGQPKNSGTWLNPDDPGCQEPGVTCHWDKGVPLGGIAAIDLSAQQPFTVSLNTSLNLSDFLLASNQATLAIPVREVFNAQQSTIDAGAVLLDGSWKGSVSNSGRFVLASGFYSGDFTNQGELVIREKSNRLQGSLNNAGLVKHTGDLALEEPSFQLSGGGTVHLIGGTVHGFTGSETLVNDNTIVGLERVSIIAGLALINTGKLETGGGVLAVNANAGGIVNSGEISAKSGNINVTGEVSNGGGILRSEGESILTLEKAKVSGGRLEGNGHPIFLNLSEVRNATLAGTTGISPATDRPSTLAGTIDNQSKIIIPARHQLFLDQATVTGGEIQFLGASSKLTVVSEESTLSDVTVLFGGPITASLRGRFGTEHLALDNTLVRGEGTLGQLRLTHSGTILASVPEKILRVDARGGPFLQNGLVQAAQGGIIELHGDPIEGNGTVEAVQDSTVRLHRVRFESGTLRTRGGTVEIVDDSRFGRISLDNEGRLVNKFDVDLRLEPAGTYKNSGEITLRPRSQLIVVDGEAAISGGGSLVLEKPSAVIGEVPGGRAPGSPPPRLVFDGNIQGEGFLGGGTADLQLRGSLFTAGRLVLQPASRIEVQGPVDVLSADGHLELRTGEYVLNRVALQLKATLDLNRVTVESSEILTDATSVVRVTAPSSFKGKLSNKGQVEITGGSLTLGSGGSYDNQGTVKLARSNKLLLSGGPVTLSGEGTWEMGPSSVVAGLREEDELVLDSTLAGEGAVGDGTKEFVLEVRGDLVATVAKRFLTIQRADLLNRGSVGAALGGVLRMFQVDSVALGSGQILVQPNSKLVLGDTILSGDIKEHLSNEKGTIEIASKSEIQDGFANRGLIAVPGRVELVLGGTDSTFLKTFVNDGEMRLAPKARLTVDGDQVLDGSGSLTMTAASIRGLPAEGSNRLTNSSLIQGTGIIGDDNLGLENLGTIQANVDRKVLSVRSSQPIENCGRFASLEGGILDFSLLEIGCSEGAGRVDVKKGQLRLFETILEEQIFEVKAGGEASLVNEITFLTSDLFNEGKISVGRSSVLSFDAEGSFSNSATVRLEQSAVLKIFGGEASLNGGGQVVLAGAKIEGNDSAVDHLINASNTLRGAGRIGDNLKQVTNRSAGTIRSETKGTLTLAPGELLNEGTLHANGGGSLIVKTESFQSPGKILIDAGSTLRVRNDDLDVSGNLTVEIGASPAQSGRVLCDLKATVTGTLTVRLQKGVTPGVGEYVLLEAASIENIANVVIPSFLAGLEVESRVTPTQLILTVR